MKLDIKTRWSRLVKSYRQWKRRAEKPTPDTLDCLRDLVKCYRRELERLNVLLFSLLKREEEVKHRQFSKEDFETYDAIRRQCKIISEEISEVDSRIQRWQDRLDFWS